MAAISGPILSCVTILLLCSTRGSSGSDTGDFPADQFWDLMADLYKPEKPSVTRDEFKRSYLCLNRTINEERKCSCELHECTRHRNCCIDIVWNSRNPKELTRYNEEFIELMLRTSIENVQLSCESILPNGTFSHESNVRVSEYFMVSTCLDQVQSICPNEYDVFPVLDSNGLIYQSPGIARCNNVKNYRHPIMGAYTYTTILKLDHLKSISNGEITLIDDDASKLSCHRENWFGEEDDRKRRLSDVYTQLEPWRSESSNRWATFVKFSGQQTKIFTKRNRRRTRLYKNCPTNQTYQLANFKCINDTCAKGYSRLNGTCQLVTLATSHHHHVSSLLPWQKNVDKVEYFITLICTALSIGGYAWAIITFLYFKELQNLPRLTAICMTSALFGSDTIFYVTFLMGDLVHPIFCRIHATVFHWCSMNAMSWAFLTAVELYLIFSQNIVIPSKINRKRFTSYFTVAALIPSILVSATVVLDHYKIVDAGYGVDGVCWITRFSARLYFYIIPIGTGYFATFIVLVRIVFSLSRKIISSRPVFKASLTHGHNITKFIINLCLILGLTEIVGFIQIRRPRGQHTELELIINASFSVLYTLLRSSRGILIAYVYIFNKNTARVLKVSMRKRFPGLFRCGENSSTEINTTPCTSGQTIYFSSTNM